MSTNPLLAKQKGVLAQFPTPRKTVLAVQIANMVIQLKQNQDNIDRIDAQTNETKIKSLELVEAIQLINEEFELTTDIDRRAELAGVIGECADNIAKCCLEIDDLTAKSREAVATDASGGEYYDILYEYKDLIEKLNNKRPPAKTDVVDFLSKRTKFTIIRSHFSKHVIE